MKGFIKSSLNRLLSPLRLQLIRTETFDFFNRLPKSTFDPVQFALEYSTREIEDFTLVQIGAFDGKANDPIYDWITKDNIKAFLIEPIPSTFEMLQKTYKNNSNVTLINSAIYRYTGKINMYLPDREDKHQLASINEKFVESSLNKTNDHGLKEIEVPSLSISDFTSQYNCKNAHFFAIDTEGFDHEIIRMILSDNELDPLFINFEHLHLQNTESEALFKLLANRFNWVHGAQDTLAINKKLGHIFNSKAWT